MNIDIIQDLSFFDKINYSKISNNLIVSSLYKLEFITTNKFNKNYLNIIKFCQKLSKTFDLTFLLFIDYTIYENNKYLKELEKIKNKNMIIIKYEFPNIKKYTGFQQFYGDLIKLCPLFNYKNNNFKNVFIFDVEYYLYNEIDKNELNLWIKTFNLYKKDKLDIIHFVFPYTKLNVKYNEINPFYLNKDKLILLSNKIICNYKFDYKIFDKIIFNSVIEKKYKQYIKNKMINKEITSQTFLTFILYNYIKKLNTGYIEFYNLYYILYKMYINYFDLELSENQNKIRQNELIKMFQFILQTDENNFKKLYNKLNMNLDDYLKRFYTYIEKMLKTKNYKIFDKNTMLYILNYKNYIKIYNFVYKDKYNFF